ncbi:MAG: hypothetical protein HYS12_02075 [Planctomycetes bacterium]|nr:hypothetical protein [Planctomycetota bacterium]
MVEDLSRDDVVRCIDRAVEKLLIQADVEGPPVDAVALARHLGLPPDEGSRRGRKRSSGNDPAPHAATTEEQKQWEAARAIGEHLKPALLDHLGFAPDEKRPMMGESLSGLVARRLLVPSAWFSADAPSCGSDLLRLKERYRTAAHEMIAFRLLDLPEPCIITVVQDDKVHRRRSNAWPVKKRLEPAEMECLRAVTRDGKPHAVRSGAWTVWGWPLWQSGRNREVLRSVVDVNG